MSENQQKRSPPERATPRDGPRRRRLIGEAETASEAVVAAVATAEDAEKDALPPLGDRFDTESLDRLVDAETRSPSAGLVFTRTEDIPTEIEVTFEYADYDVTVSDNYVVLE
ncbi:HalOD1 output domain-containing protein [Halorussus lipolyticus]|uniref:HalOD1 output domain-containing protein n=1 Tax=Halorussus lipolyticus TaxID=3034024 RepID=UPI0023E7E9AE|nr:HalOD1 output domain-containing protein [Halorussus sp. DT80]